MAQENVVTADLLNGAGSEKNNNGSSVTPPTKAVSFFSVKPQLVVSAPKGADAVQFYKNAFGAEELKRDIHPKRKAEQELPLILSAELKLGSSVFQVSDQVDGSPASVTSNGSGITLCIETDDVEAAIAKAVQAGAVAEKGGEVAEGETACCGGRVGKVTDPFGYVWLICSTDANKVVDVEA